MPVSPDMAEDLAAAVSTLYEQVELALIEKVTRALAEGIDSPLWAELKLAALGNLRSAIDEIIAVLQTDASGAIHQAVAEAYDRGQQAAVLELGAVATGPALAAAEALPTAPAVDRLAAALVSETGATHARILRTGLDVYRQVIAEASAAPLLGATTRRQAAEQALAKFAGRGVTGFVDRSGRAWNLTSYAEMASRSALGRAAVQAHTDRLGAAGIDLVMVSDAPEECPIGLSLRKRVAGVETQLGAYTPGLTHVAGTFYRVRVQIVGSTLRARMWAVTDPEPNLWGIEVTDTALTAAANVGTRSVSNAGNTNVNPVIRYGNFQVVNPQKWTVSRSLNGVVKAQTAGTPVALSNPARVAL
ncbi:phage minor capsid protein [Streptomyces sp. NPDC087843]|uniref:phage minor capsid protein n=1 Tax=Streptomyces sp. NPDC087843 TaxID=3365804 RepID=UPI00380D285E